MSLLSQLLSPCDVEEFLTHYWTNQAVAISGKGQKAFTHFFSWEKLNHLLNFHSIKYPDLRLAFEGKALDESETEHLRAWCQKGATLILDQVHLRIPEIRQLTTELTDELGCKTQVNAYCSWSSSQGFSCHYDTHEVIVLQIEGSKKWSVYPDTFKWPLREQKSAQRTPPTGETYLDCVLHPGDVLYIPRGHWHYAQTQIEPSIHLTIGIHCPTGIHFLEWIVSQLKQQQEWRKSLPIRIENRSMQSGIKQLIQQLNHYLEKESLSDEYPRYLESIENKANDYDFPYQAGFNIFRDGIETRFRTPQFQRIQIQEISLDQEYKILVAGREVLLKGVSRTLVENLFSQKFFRGRDVMNWLPDYDWELDLVPLLSRLVTEGVIFVDPDNQS